jgi:hypothetical protein
MGLYKPLMRLSRGFFAVMCYPAIGLGGLLLWGFSVLVLWAKILGSALQFPPLGGLFILGLQLWPTLQRASFHVWNERRKKYFIHLQIFIVADFLFMFDHLFYIKY